MSTRAALLKPKGHITPMEWTARELGRTFAKDFSPPTALFPRFKRSLQKLMEAKP